MRYLLLAFLLILVIQPASSQIYDVQFKDNKVQFITPLVFWSGVQIYDRLRPAEIIDEYKDIDPNRLWNFDRRLIGNKSSRADLWSDITLLTSMAAPMVLRIDKRVNQEGWGMVYMCLQGFFIENGLNQIIKIVTDRPRPYIYFEGESILNKSITKNSTKSFFSGHASTAAYFSFFAAKVFSDTHPDSKWKPAFWVVASGISGVTAYLRTKAGKHFYSDVIAGWIFGASIGIMIPEINKKKNSHMTLGFTSSGVSFSYHFK